MARRDVSGSPVIPAIDVARGRTTKPAGIGGLSDPSDPVEVALHHRGQGAERVLMRILDPWEDRDSFLPLLRRMANLGVPLWVTVDNGVPGSAGDLAELLDLGAEAVGVFTASAERPSMLHHTSGRFGRDRVLGVMKVRRAGQGGWNVATRGGGTPVDARVWAAMLADLGAGLILPHSLDREGTGRGFDLELIQAMTEAVDARVAASGGCGTPRHLEAALARGAANVLVNRMLHEGACSLGEVTRHVRAGHTIADFPAGR
ncbi:HisA/HisF-related TIM barrel protein [Bailinhaonella thermotolerans]|nr:HisA/HisF-related TIM barrel protein [Bailinhaonella thermotolerans]